jgi:hypothetical protein
MSNVSVTPIPVADVETYRASGAGAAITWDFLGRPNEFPNANRNVIVLGGLAWSFEAAPPIPSELSITYSPSIDGWTNEIRFKTKIEPARLSGEIYFASPLQFVLQLRANNGNDLLRIYFGGAGGAAISHLNLLGFSQRIYTV